MTDNIELTGFSRLLDQMDLWRNFPHYRLEFRADLVFGMFLPEILGKSQLAQESNVEIHPRLIPEFPFPHGLQNTESKNRTSDRIDFAVFGSLPDGRYCLYLIELKTDSSSINDPQNEKLAALETRNEAEQTIKDWLESIKSVIKSTKQKGKYLYVLHALSEWGLIKEQVLAPILEKYWNSGSRSGLQALVERLSINDEISSNLQIKTILITPDRYTTELEKPLLIRFSELAHWLRKQRTSEGERFALSLEKWNTRAGAMPPGQ